jgi:hypothetical protein
VVAGTIPKSKNGKFNHKYGLVVKNRRGNWGYKINAEKNRSKDIKEEWKLYRSIFGKYRYTSLELGVRSRRAPCCPGFRLPCFSRTGEGLPLGKIRAIALRIIYNRLALGKVALFYRNREFRSRLGAT